MARQCIFTADVAWAPLSVASNSLLNPSSISLFSWFFCTSASPVNFTNAFLRRQTTSGSTQYLMSQPNGGNKMGYFVSTATVNGTTSMSVNKWYAVGLTYDSTNGLKSYINGASDGTAAAVGALPSGTTPLVMGGDPDFAENIGETTTIADNAMWSTVLTQAEFLALSNGARPYQIRPANLVGWWPLDGIESTEPDLSGHKLNATISTTSGTVSKFPGPPYMPFTPRNQNVEAFAQFTARQRTLVGVGV